MPASSHASQKSTALPAPEQKHDYVREMFDTIAPRYDMLNSVLSARLHHSWRKRAVAATNLHPGQCALDVCTGTGDLAFEIARRVGKTGRVTATDFSAPMLQFAHQKNRKRGNGHAAPIVFDQADTQRLPFADNAFDAVTVGFGIRNVADVPQGLSEMARVTKPGGRVVVLEFSQPQNKAFAALYRWYSFRVLPVIGGIISGSRGAYTYLPTSVEAWATRDGLARAMETAGLTGVQITDLTLGTVAIHSALKPVQ